MGKGLYRNGLYKEGHKKIIKWGEMPKRAFGKRGECEMFESERQKQINYNNTIFKIQDYYFVQNEGMIYLKVGMRTPRKL